MRSTGIMLFVVTSMLVVGFVSTADELEPKDKSAAASKSADEARARARILHEAFHGALQVMHRDFFDEDEARVLPSGSLEDVFSEMERTHDVKLAWMSVNAKAMNVDHTPQGEFQKAAAQAISAGDTEFELVQQGRYHFAGSIRLASQCLKCHLPRRTSTKDRAAALLISMPIDRISRGTSAELTK